jgi:ribonuclease J
MKKDKMEVLRTKVPTDYVLVDGLSHGDIGNVVIRDRQQLAKEGMITIICPIDKESGTLARKPEILSRGFIYMKSSTRLLDEVREKVKQIISDNQGGPHSVNWFYVQGEIKEEIAELLYKRTRRNPMVLPIVFEV